MEKKKKKSEDGMKEVQQTFITVKKCRACGGTGEIEHKGEYVTCNVCDGYGSL